MEKETQVNFDNIQIETRGLDTTKFMVQASSQEDAVVSVSVRGVESLLKNLTEADITAYVDLSNITEPGTYKVPVYADGNDTKLTYTSRTKNVQVIITAR